LQIAAAPQQQIDDGILKLIQGRKAEPVIADFVDVVIACGV
jgi:hypothetical protein